MFFCIGCELVGGGVAAIPVIGFFVTRYRTWRYARARKATVAHRDPNDEAETYLVANGDDWQEITNG